MIGGNEKIPVRLGIGVARFGGVQPNLLVAPGSKPKIGPMTKLLDKLFEGLSKLPEAEQDAVAAFVLEELAAEKRWAAALDDSRDAIDRLAVEALAEHRAGVTRPLDPERL